MSNKGFSLVSVMIAAALAGGVALLVVRISQNAQSVQKTSEANFSSIALHSRVTESLLDPKACKATFKQSLVPNLTNGVSLTEIFKKGAGSSYSIGNHEFEGIEITSATIRNLAYPNSMPTPGNSALAEFDLEIIYTKNDDGMYESRVGGKTIKKFLPIVSIAKAIGPSEIIVENCYEGSVASLCTSLGGSFDITQTPNCQIAAVQAPMPRDCTLNLSHKNGKDPAMSTFLTLDTSGYAGLRMGRSSTDLGNNVDDDDYLHLDGRCYGTDDYSKAFSKCSVTLGHNDVDIKATTPTSQRTNSIGSSSNNASSSSLKMVGDVNGDDNLFIKWSCPKISSSDPLSEKMTYLKQNCALCLGHSDGFLRTPQNSVCVKEGDPRWGILDLTGTVNYDDFLFVGFYCGYYPGNVIQRIQW